MYCPQCGTPNSPESLFCVKCNTRLSVAQQGGDDLPPWLRQLDDQPAATASSVPTGMPEWMQTPPATESSPTPPPPSELPPWLRDVESAPAIEQPSAASSALPSWLSELQDSAPPTSELPDVAPYVAPQQELPSWLSELQGDTTSAPPAPSAPPPAPVAPAANDVPSWLQEIEPMATPAAAAPASGGGDLPDWLRTDLPSAPPPAPSASVAPVAPVANDVPSWLQEIEPTAAPAAAAPAGNDVPSWLQEIEPTAAPAAAAPASGGGDLPDWLRTDLPSAPPPAPSAPAANDVPSWLQEIEPMAALAAVAPAQNDVPSWLQEVETPTVQPDEGIDDPSAIPNWMQDLRPNEQPAAPPRIVEPQNTSMRRPATGDLPSWLRDFDSDPPIVELSEEDLTMPVDTNDVPDWLLGVAPSAHQAEQTSMDAPSWLSAPEPPSAPTSETKPANPASDIPDWLREPASAAPFEANDGALPAQSTSSDVPDWLKDVDDHAQSAIQSPTNQSQPAPSDIPAWLRDDALAAAPPSAPTPTVKLDTPSNDIPAWLRDDALAAAPPSAPTPTVKLDTPSNDIPAWLRDDALAAAPPSAPTPTVKLDTPSDDVPAWLRDDALAAAPPSAPTPTVKLDAPSDDVPAWLRDDVSAPVEPVKLDDSSDVPEWLRDATTAPPTIKQDQTPGDIPAWLREEAPIAPTPQASVTAASSWLLDDEPTASPADNNAMLGNVDLPSWLRQSATGAEPVPLQEVPQATQSNDWLRVLGNDVPETVPNEASDATPRRYAVALPPAIERTPERIAAVDLLRQLIENPLPEPAAEVAAAPQTWWQKVGIERFIAGLLLITILVGLLVPNLGLGAATNNSLGGNSTDLYNYIESLNSDSRVLVAFEADLRHSGELAPLQKAVFDHLTQKRVPMLLVSTDQEGTLVEEQHIRTYEQAKATAGEPWIQGEDYLKLDYLAGGRAGIAQLARDIRGTVSTSLAQQGQPSDVNFLKIMSRVNSAGQYDSPIVSGGQDLFLLVIIADHPDDVQAWMEQFWSKSPALPVAILATNETFPQIQPLVQISRNSNDKATFYPVAGITGAQAYTSLRNTSAADSAPFQALTLGSLVIIGLLLVGGIMGIQRRLREKRKLA